MSYRNPQIIIDNSGEIWGKAIANFGRQMASGIKDYAETKNQARKAQKKKTETTKLVYQGMELQNNKMINDLSGKIKDNEMLNGFQDNARKAATTGEGFSVWVEGKDGKKEQHTFGALDAMTQLKINPNIPPNIKEAYNKTITQYQNFLKSSVGYGAEIVAGNESLADAQGSGNIGNTMDFADQFSNETLNMFAAYSTSNLPLEGVVSTKKPWRKEDGEGYKNMLTVDSRIDTQSKTYQRLKDAGMLDLDGDGTIDPRFKVDEKDSRYINVSWERDLDKWAKKGNLIVPIKPKDATTDVLDVIGYTEKGKPVDDKGWLKNNIRTVRTENRDGKVIGESSSNEKHFDAIGMWNDPVYQGELDGVAAGILALPPDQQLKYISNTLGWGNKITKEKWANTPPNSSEGRTGQIDFLKLQAYEQHMEDITGENGRRKATPNDVAEYQAMYPDREEDQTLKEDNWVYFKKDSKDKFTPTPEVKQTQEEKDAIKTQKEVEKELNKEVKSRENAITRVSTILDNPEKNAALVGMGSIFSIKDKIVKTSVPQFDKYDKPIEAKEVTFNLDNDKEFISYISHMVKARKGIKSSEVDVISKMLLNTKVPKGSSLYEIFKSGIDVDSKEASMSRFNNKHIKTKG